MLHGQLVEAVVAGTVAHGGVDKEEVLPPGVAQHVLQGGVDTVDALLETVEAQGVVVMVQGISLLEGLAEVSGHEFEMPQGVLRDMIGRTLFAIAVDESRPILTGCLLEIGQQELRVVALDGFRLALRKEPIVGPQEPVCAVVGGKILGDISKTLGEGEDPVAIRVSRSHIQLEIGKTRIVARLLEGEFIRYRQILPEEWQTRITVGRADLGSAIDRASLIAREGKNNLVCFKIDGGELLVTSNSESGDVEERMPISTEGKDLTIAFNVRYITDVLKALSDDEVYMRFNSNVSPCVVCPTQGDAYLYLVLPVRVFGA